MTPISSLRIVGLGSPNGDDAVGWAAIDLLEKLPMPPGCELCRAHGGHELLDWLEGIESLVLIDALMMPEDPGSVHKFTWPDARIEMLEAVSTHRFGAAAALSLARSIGILPRRVVIVGVAIGSTGPGDGLSSQVAAALPHAAECVRELVRGCTET